VDCGETRHYKNLKIKFWSPGIGLEPQIHKLARGRNIPIRFVDFSFGEMRIYSCRDFPFIFSLIFEDFLIDLLKN
jgi:hypothetical protein